MSATYFEAQGSSMGGKRFDGVVCRGSFVLGSACGRCERCDEERRKLQVAAEAVAAVKSISDRMSATDAFDRFPAVVFLNGRTMVLHGVVPDEAPVDAWLPWRGVYDGDGARGTLTLRDARAHRYTLDAAASRKTQPMGYGLPSLFVATFGVQRSPDALSIEAAMLRERPLEVVRDLVVRLARAEHRLVDLQREALEAAPMEVAP